MMAKYQAESTRTKLGVTESERTAAPAFVAYGRGAYAAPRARMSAKVGICCWCSCFYSTRLSLSGSAVRHINTRRRHYAHRRLARLRLVQLMVPTRGGPGRA